MKVLMISARADHGGGPRHMELLIENLPSHTEVHVACPDDQPYGARFKRLVSSRISRIPHREFAFGAVVGVIRYVRKNQIQLIHCHGKGAGLYGRIVSAITGVPCVHTPHGVHVGGYGVRAKRLYRLYENLSSRWVDHLVYVSSDEQSEASLNGLWPHVDSSVIVNGVNDVPGEEVVACRLRERRSMGLDEDCLVVATVSRFDRQKNMHEALEIAKLLPECLFLWIGSGEEKNALEMEATAAGAKNVFFVGQVDSPLSLLAAADVYLSTSLWEGMPLAILEAMSVGLPIVATRVVGHRELVESSGCGVLYEQGQVMEAVEALRSFEANAALRGSVGARGRDAQRQNYSTRRQGRMIAELYMRISGKRTVV